METDTHTWFSRGSAGSVHSPRGLLGSMPRGLADLGFPAESRGGSRPFSSRPGDRQFFSDPSNWAVRNILVMDSEIPGDTTLSNSQFPTLLLPSPQKGQRHILGGHAHQPACLTPGTKAWATMGVGGIVAEPHQVPWGLPVHSGRRGRTKHEKPLKLSPSADCLPFFHPPQGSFSVDNIVSFSSSEFITVLQIALPSHSVEMTY